MKVEFCRQIFEKYWNITFYKNPSSGTRVVSCTDERAERKTDMTKLIVAFRNFANAPKNALFRPLVTALPYSFTLSFFLKQEILTVLVSWCYVYITFLFKLLSLYVFCSVKQVWRYSLRVQRTYFRNSRSENEPTKVAPPLTHGNIRVLQTSNTGPVAYSIHFQWKCGINTVHLSQLYHVSFLLDHQELTVYRNIHLAKDIFQRVELRKEQNPSCICWICSCGYLWKKITL
jgi:hypothetical protein